MVSSRERQEALLRSKLHFLKKLLPLNGDQRVWLVGGSVRDAILGKDIKDLDLVATVPGKELEKHGFRLVKGVTTAPIWFRNFKEIGNVEITAVESLDLLLEDLKRRDFTLNALLMTLDGEAVDPLGGLADLQAGKLEPCSRRTFIDDPIRIFRAFRLEAEGFSVSDRALELIRCAVWDEKLKSIPVERFSREMLKALQGAKPGIYFQRMIELKVGSSYLPELFAMTVTPAGPLQHHPEGDLFAHSIQVLERISALSDLTLARFCGFFHDIGKLSTEPQFYPKHHGHDEAGFKVAAAFCRRLALPNEYGRALAWTSRLHSNANRFAELRPSTMVRMVEQSLRAGIVDILPQVAMADRPGSIISSKWRDALEVAGMNLKELAISQEMIESMNPSKRSGYILQRKVELLKLYPRSIS